MWRFLFVFLAAPLIAAPAAPFGRYVGVVRHETLKRDQLAKLDFIASREENNVLTLKAVLTLHFGDFKSGEYVGYHFDNVRFNLITQSFIFDQADQAVTLVVKKFTGDEFVGEFRSTYSGEIFPVLMGKGKKPELKYPLIEPVWGEYAGMCTSRVTGKPALNRVQLYTHRSNGGADQVGNPFRPYEITGFLGEDHGSECLSGSEKMCVWGNVSSGSYNFFRNSMVVFNNFRNLVCTTTPDGGLKCDGCEAMKRISSETKGERALLPPEPKSILGDVTGDGPALTDEVDAIQGEYVGWVHHEYLDLYQPGSLNILTYQAIDPDGQGEVTLRMSAAASLTFGEDNLVEALSYRFNERPYPNPLAAPQFVFSQTQGDVDAILQITNLGKGWVKGVWFSRLFGRVGDFVFKKGARQELPKEVRKMEPISGYFQSSQWEMELQVGLGTAQTDTVNPFSPLTLGGWMILPSVTPKKHFAGGSYDFYTGKIGIEGPDFVYQVGYRNSRRRLALKKLHNSVLSPMPDHEPVPFRLLEGIEP